MAEVRVSEAHSPTPGQAVERVRSFEDMLAKFGVKAQWKGHQAALNGTGVTGSINVSCRCINLMAEVAELPVAVHRPGLLPKNSFAVLTRTRIE